jgi:hypothetical protein
MGWINMCWGVPLVLDVSIGLPHEATLALDKVVEQKCVSLFLTQLTIESARIILSLEAPFDFVTTGWCIHICERNELKSFDKD